MSRERRRYTSIKQRAGTRSTLLRHSINYNTYLCERENARCQTSTHHTTMYSSWSVSTHWSEQMYDPLSTPVSPAEADILIGMKQYRTRLLYSGTPYTDWVFFLPWLHGACETPDSTTALLVSFFQPHKIVERARPAHVFSS